MLRFAHMKKGIRKHLAFTATFMLVLLCFYSGAQISSLAPVLVGSAGGYVTSPTMSLSYSIGEPVITTASTSTLILTQGFQQPSSDSVLGLQFRLSKTDLTCSGSNDGTALATVTTGRLPITFLWNTTPPQTSQIAKGLSPGIYVCKVTDGSGLTMLDSVTILNSNAICGIHVYSGFTPNGDNKNDTWIIDYIDLYQPNTVTVYNRWGDKVWTTTNYNNLSNVWKGTDYQAKNVPDGTYYYVIEVGSQVQKGWVEVNR